MDSFAYTSHASTATNSTASSRRTSFSKPSNAVSPFQSWLLTRNITQLIPGRPLSEIEAIFTPLTNFYPDLWTHAPFPAALTHKMLAAVLDPHARPAQVAAKLRACAQLGKLLWNLSNAAAARLLLLLDRRIIGCGVLSDEGVSSRYLGNGNCHFYPELRRELGLSPLDRDAGLRWWARREAWVRERRGSPNNWDNAVVKVMRGLVERRARFDEWVGGEEMV